MAKYLKSSDICELIKIRNKIFPERIKAFDQYKIDVLDNDVLSSLSIWEIVSQYDDNYNINFARNGEDAISNNVIIEQKCASIIPSKKGKIKSAAFQFHAMGNLEYPRYIFVVRRKDNLNIVRLYDIKHSINTKIILDHLMNERNKWLEKGKLNEVKNMKRDVITLPETMFQTTIKITNKLTVNNCEVFMD